MPKNPSEEDRAAAEMFGDKPDLAEALAEEAGSAHPILSAQEVSEARAKARAAVEAKRKKAATEALIAEETLRLEQEEGLTTGSAVKDEMVEIFLDLAEHSDKIVLSGRPYHHGQTYRVPRHVADTLREIMSRGHNHQNEIEGKAISDRFRRPHASIVGVAGARNVPKYQGGAVV